MRQATFQATKVKEIPAVKLVISEAKSCANVLRGLISYHERMTMGNYPERDFYLDALRYALSLVEKEIEREANK